MINSRRERLSFNQTFPTQVRNYHKAQGRSLHPSKIGPSTRVYNKQYICSQYQGKDIYKANTNSAKKKDTVKKKTVIGRDNNIPHKIIDNVIQTGNQYKHSLNCTI